MKEIIFPAADSGVLRRGREVEVEIERSFLGGGVNEIHDGGRVRVADGVGPARG